MATAKPWDYVKRRRYAPTPEQHRQRMRVYMRERYKLLTSVGLCVRCGKREPERSRKSTRNPVNARWCRRCGEVIAAARERRRAA